MLLLEAGPDYLDPAHIPDEVKYGHTRYAEGQDSEHNWALRGTITEEQGEIHVAQGKVIGGGSSINGQAMQRGFPEDYDSWAALATMRGRTTRSCPTFVNQNMISTSRTISMARTAPCPSDAVRPGPGRTPESSIRPVTQAGFGISKDTNGQYPAGLGVAPSNNIDGMRMSAALTHLMPMRHRLNLTVRGKVHVRKVLFDGTRAVGVEAESGGEVFTIEADRVVLSAGAIRSPQLLMLSGIGPKDHLQQFGIPIVHESPGVGRNLMNHLSAQIAFKVKDDIVLTTHVDAVNFSLHYTAEGSSVDQ